MKLHFLFFFENILKVFSTIATVCSVIVTPLLYYYIQTIQTILTNEIEFCQQRSQNMWKEYAYIDEVFFFLSKKIEKNFFKF